MLENYVVIHRDLVVVPNLVDLVVVIQAPLVAPAVIQAPLVALVVIQTPLVALVVDNIIIIKYSNTIKKLYLY
jgi:hypothetical protein